MISIKGNVLNLKKYLLLILLFVSNTINADPFNSFVTLHTEQTAVADWMISNASVKLQKPKAMSIVHDTYAYAVLRKLDPLLLIAMMKVESGFKENAVSDHGAVGLLQVMPKYHKARIKKRNPMTANVSIDVGSSILRECFDKHSNNKKRSLNCYSGGGGLYYLTKVMQAQKKLSKYLADNSISMSSSMIASAD